MYPHTKFRVISFDGVRNNRDIQYVKLLYSTCDVIVMLLECLISRGEKIRENSESSTSSFCSNKTFFLIAEVSLHTHSKDLQTIKMLELMAV